MSTEILIIDDNSDIRIILEELSPKEYEHPLDREALNKLESIPGVKPLFKKIYKEIYEKLDYIQNSGSNLLLTKDNFPRVTKILDQAAKVLDVNLTSNFLISKFFIKKMIKNKSGKIVNITSIVGHTGNIGQANYAASKSGIIGMSKSLALEYAKKNILINCISPGFIDTAMTDKIDDKFKAQLIDKIPINRLGKPLDVANAVSFLMSDLSNYITGETIHVNGGMYFG